MAITAGVANQFKMDVLIGVHNLTLAADAIWMALYPSGGTVAPTNATYPGTGEHAATGTYVAGGKVLTNITPVLNGTEGCASFQPITWAASTITAAGAQIYNLTKSSKSIAVLSFGGDKTSSAGDFAVTFPAQTATNAIVRIT